MKCSHTSSKIKKEMNLRLENFLGKMKRRDGYKMKINTKKEKIL